MAVVFISYKAGTPNNQEAELLYNELTKQGHNVFLDRREFYAGVAWDNSIYKNISKSDVLIVILTPDAISPWVQREVDYALGCRVSILPVVIRDDDLAHVEVVQQKLAISSLNHARAFGIRDPSLRYGEVFNAIPTLTKETRQAQKEWVMELQNKWKEEDKKNPRLQPHNPTRVNYATYSFFIPGQANPHPCKISITAGNITQVTGIDALVNSENVYMQMQRVFANESVSKRIRLDGAQMVGNLHIEHDTIQDELNSYLFANGAYGTPVEQGTVIVTSAGGEQSKLSKKGVKYIFHVAVVQATTDKEFPVENASVVSECVENCLKKVDEINATASADKKVKSIVFPALASGNAGLDFNVSVGAVLDSIKEYLHKSPSTELENIYIAAYTRGNVDDLKAIFHADPLSFRAM